MATEPDDLLKTAANLPGPADDPTSPWARALAQPTLLGLFLPTFHGGWSASTLPRGTDWSFDYNAALVQSAEALGFDLAFGYSLWLPKGGEGPTRTDLGLESLTSAAALSALTKRIIIVGTVHLLYGPWHPLHLAKFGATLDHISKGRWGFNIVTGHRAAEHELFGRTQIEHDQRYVLADEAVSVLRQLWHDEQPFSYDSNTSWRFKDAYVSPKALHHRPVLMTATGSAAGIGFAARHADVVFIASPAGADLEAAIESLPAHTSRIKQAAREQGRTIRTLINPMVIARETDSEARAYADAIVAHADLETLAGGQTFASDAHAWRNYKPDASAVIGGNLQLIGSPQTIVEQMVRLRDAGVDGFHIAFYDFVPDLAFFGERVLPLMVEAGLRFEFSPDL